MIPLSVFLPDDWSTIFVPDTPLIEIVVRGTVVYLFLFFLLRVVMKREASGIGITDLLVVVLLADAAQNAMGDDYQSIPNGLLLVSTIVFWSWFLSYLAFRIPPLRTIIRPRPILLIRDGQMVEDNIRRELLTHEEITGHLREHGIERVEDVKRAWMESDGMITAIPRDGGGRQGENAQRKKLLH